MDEMVALTKVQVPDYLMESEFYNSLNEDDDEEFSIPRKFFKPTVHVASAADLSHLFHTMKFWGVQRLPKEIIELIIFKSTFVPSREHEPIRNVLLEFDPEFHLSRNYDMSSTCFYKRDRLRAAVQWGREDVLDYVLRYDDQPVSAAIIKVAAENGQVHFLQRLISDFEPKLGTSKFDKVSTYAVAGGGHTECLLYLLQNGCKKEKNTCRGAAENGHLACLKVAREHGCLWNKCVAEAAAMYGHLNCLQYVMEQGGAGKVTDMACAAASRGQLECLQYVLDQGVVPTRGMCYAACVRGSLPCLQLLRARGATWDVVCARRAAEHGSLACLKYLLEEGCKVDSSVTRLATESGRVACLELLIAAGCAMDDDCVDLAARRGLVSCLKTLKNHDALLLPEQVHQLLRSFGVDKERYLCSLVQAGYAIPQSAILSAAQYGDIASMEYICTHKLCDLNAEVTVAATFTHRCAALFEILHNYGCPWDAQTCTRVAQQGDIAALTFAYEHGCPWDERTTTAAVHDNGLECLKYALENDCPCSDDDLCELAASRGLFDILKCMHEHGCVLTLDTCIAAAANKYTDCLIYAVTRGAPVDESICVVAVSPDSSAQRYYDDYNKVYSIDMLERAHELGCPWDERTIITAITYDEVECLQYALMHRCPCSVDSCEHAALRGKNDMLQLLREYGCPWDASTATAAARAGLVNTLTYALEHGCPCDVETCLAAVEGGSLTCLQLLHEHGCPWDERVSEAAAQTTSTSCLRYCVEQGCPISKATMRAYNLL